MYSLARKVILLLFVFQPTNLIACDIGILQIKFFDLHSKIKVEVADSHQERKKGLMFRDSLDPDSGMLFVYDHPQKVGFWMKNTLVALDIVFADSKGTVMRVAQNNKPLSLDVIRGGENIQYVLEVNAGKSEELNLFKGAKLYHPAIYSGLAEDC